MTQIVINIENDNLVPSLKEILKSISGVISVKTKRSDTPTFINEATGKVLNNKTANLIKRVEEGKEDTKSFDSVDALMKDLQS